MSGELQSVKQIRHSLDQFENVVPDQSVAWTREASSNRRVDRLNAPVRIDRKYAVPRRVQDRCAPRFTVGQSNHQAAALADDRTEHETGRSQCQHEKLEGPKGGLQMTLNFEAGDQAYLDRQHRPARSG